MNFRNKFDKILAIVHGLYLMGEHKSGSAVVFYVGLLAVLPGVLRHSNWALQSSARPNHRRIIGESRTVLISSHNFTSCQNYMVKVRQ